MRCRNNRMLQGHIYPQLAEGETITAGRTKVTDLLEIAANLQSQVESEDWRVLTDQPDLQAWIKDDRGKTYTKVVGVINMPVRHAVEMLTTFEPERSAWDENWGQSSVLKEYQPVL